MGLFLFSGWVAPLGAEVQLPSLFADHMVLQRDIRVPVWGRGDPGEKVTVSFGGQQADVIVSSAGKWRLDLGPFDATAKSADLIVTGRNTIVVRDVAVGEVWLCSGQSNMTFTVGEAQNARAEIEAAKFPLIRHYTVTRSAVDQPADEVAGTWVVCSPESVADFTAVGYFFARDIQRELGIPVGLIHSSWGGTYIESWMSEETLRKDPAFAVVLKRREEFLAQYPQAMDRYTAALAEWKALAAAEQAAGRKFTEPEPRSPIGPGHRNLPTNLYNGMIRPRVPYGLRGVLWYQGEANSARVGEYRALFAALIGQWRREWNLGDFPFYFAQLSSFKSFNKADGEDLGYLREAQAQALELPNTGMAVTFDVGDADNVHPTNKQEVGRRLALIAKGRDYQLPVVGYSGPIFRALDRQGQTMVLHFEQAAGLNAGGEALRGFEIAADDGRFVPATSAVGADGTVNVESGEVPEPVAVRYAWRNVTDGNLVNAAGLPTGTFRASLRSYGETTLLRDEF